MPSTSGSARMERTLQMMQNYMIQKGLIDESMNEDEIIMMMQEDRNEVNSNDNHTLRQRSESRQRGMKQLEHNEGQVGGDYLSPSDTTVDKNAVDVADLCNVSSSSEDNKPSNDSVDKGKSRAEKLVDSVTDDFTYSGTDARGRRERSTSRGEDRHGSPRRDARGQGHQCDHFDNRRDDRRFVPEAEDVQEQADRLVREAEHSKARMLDIPGTDDNVIANNRALLHSVIIDEGYLQVAAHVDDSLHMKIQNFEYVDFVKLLPQEKIVQEEDNRLTFINKGGGVPYLVPASDIKEGQIGSYSKWNRAFRVFCEIVTQKYPEKAQELLQYDHIIHTASQTYQWDNVSVYDRDFRIHISKNLTRTWAVILQQAWSMRLTDKLRDFFTGQARGESSSTPKSKDYCRRFQKERCHDGLSCKYEHCCAICNKFGHGAHICRHRKGGGSYRDRNDSYNHDRQSDKYHYYNDKRDRSPSHQHGNRDGRSGRGQLEQKKSHK